MFTGFSEKTGAFLWDLAFNNERPWFLAHKQEFEDFVNTPFKALAADSFEALQARFPDFEGSVHVSRIYRDARRLFGRGPYKDHLWFSVKESKVLLEGPMLWFEIGPAEYSYGMGFYSATPVQMEAFRRAVDLDPAAFGALVKDLAAHGPYTLWGQEYKRPKGDLGPDINPWYNRKHFSAGYERPFGGQLFSPDLPRIVADAFQDLMPLYRFLCRVTGDVYARREALKRLSEGVFGTDA